MSNAAPIKQSVEQWLNETDYRSLRERGYTPSEFAINYVNFIKMVNSDAGGEANKTPVVHLKMLDELAGDRTRLANLCSRGLAKTTLFGEYLTLYIALYGEIDGFGDVSGMIYISDSMENGVKSLRKNIEHRYNNSEFLRKYIPEAKFTDAYMEFTNADGHKLGVRLFGSKSGLRGTKIFGKRPVLAVLDDLVSDDDAKSKSTMQAIKDTVYKGVDYALDPTRRKIVFSGTPFNKNDILYEAVESGGWYVNVFPICEQYPCTKEEFVGAWEDRFSYEFVKEQYDLAVATGQVASFNQELMLRITSDEEKLIPDSCINWFKRSDLLLNKDNYNYYITTDFATSAKKSADFSVITVWGYNNKGYWFLVDGICKRQDMGSNIEDLFALAQKWNVKSVGIEVTGQQGGFVSWIQGEMMRRNQWFSLASGGNQNQPGIRPVTDKLNRFYTVEPWFKQGIMFFPEELKGDNALMDEMLNELSMVTKRGFLSKHDDVLDCISMLSVMTPWKPSKEDAIRTKEDPMWEPWEEDDTGSSLGSYVV